MKQRTTIILMLLACLLMGGSGRFGRGLLERRVDRTPMQSLEQAPPLIVFSTVVFGGFRGVVTDMLWLRLSSLQDAGRFIEVVQLADWITKLEPRRGKVWSYHAWNMAYNVSIMMPTPQDRYRWVQNGIELLRDEGLAYNPDDYRIHHELAWILLDKVGGMSDEFGPYYRNQWKAEMTELFGGPRPDYGRLEGDSRKLAELQNRYKMDPALMREVEKVYGELNWTSPLVHALYWAYRGYPRATGFGKTKLEQTLRMCADLAAKEARSQDDS